MKILVADKIAATGVQRLKDNAAFQVVEAYGTYKDSPEKFMELVKDASGLIVRSETQVTSEVLAAAPHLKAIARAGAGTDNIDKEEATRRGIVVMNTPGGNTIATAELTFTHLLCAARPIVQACATMREGGWDRKKYSGSELNGKVLGICGLGRVGIEVATRAIAFNMEVLAYDPFLTAERADSLGVKKVELDEVLANSDYITVHMPLTEQTRDLINKESIAKMKDGVKIVNVARGGIINEADLQEALQSGKVACAGLDVYSSEPLEADSSLRKETNLVLTPHLGASTQEAQDNVGIMAADLLEDYLVNGTVMHAVNVPSVDAKTLKVLKPYLDLGEKLGAFVQQITPDVVNFLKITYLGVIADMEMVPVTRKIQRGYLRHIADADVNEINAKHIIDQLGIKGEVVKSQQDCDYTALIRIEAVSPDDKKVAVEASLFGPQQQPRLVSINGRQIEVELKQTLLVLENDDVPGIVGMLGTVLAKHGININNMALSLGHEPGSRALSVYELDQKPSADALKEISEHPKIHNVTVAQL